MTIAASPMMLRPFGPRSKDAVRLFTIVANQSSKRAILRTRHGRFDKAIRLDPAERCRLRRPWQCPGRYGDHDHAIADYNEAISSIQMTLSPI